MEYKDFLKTKRLIIADHNDIRYHPSDHLFDFQNKIVELALKKKRYAVFADCGLGKTRIQLHWANLISQQLNAPILIVAPLAVSQQTVKEGLDIGIDVKRCRSQADCTDGINITNYEMISHFDPAAFVGVVLDESSILKNFTGKLRNGLIDSFSNTEYRLCCTATAAPNDLLEIVNHSEFLGYMNEKEAKAMFFIQDGNNTQKWRLKGHSEKDFWLYISMWSIALRTPEDMGYTGSDYHLPELMVKQIAIKSQKILNDGYLLPLEATTLTERREARVNSLEERLQKTLGLLANWPDESVVIWCDLNAESELLTKNIPHGKEIRGSHSIEYKEKTLEAFANGEIKVLITKPSIAGFGLNWQHCNKVIFFGLSDSYERFYQAVRRCWRFGQKRDVEAYVVTSDTEAATVRNIERKEKATRALYDNIIKNLNSIRKEQMGKTIEIRKDSGDGWTMYNNDCIDAIDDIESASIGLSIFSPPFPAMYAYSDSPRDIGNTKDFDQHMKHFSYVIAKDKLFRVLMPGRNVCIHLTQVPAFKHADGYIGLKDFRGKTIEMMQEAGWHYYSEVAINKNPQVKALRTKDSTLTFQGLAKDSAQSRPAMADYLLIFKKPGENPHPIKSGNTPRHPNENGWITDQDWIQWAHPVWNDIKETNVLNVRAARDEKDEKHLCPLQLDVIKRAVLLWSNPNEIVLSPFAGIGSEGHEAINHDRQFVGIELKDSYFNQACINMEQAIKEKKQWSLI